MYTTYGVCIKVQGLYLAAGSNLFFHYFFVPPLDPQVPDRSSRIDPTRFPIEAEYLQQPIVIQVESLDFAVIGHQIGGRAVTPFLNDLWQKALALKLDPKHTAIAGSSGADFQFLSQEPVRPGTLPAKQNGLETLPSLPRELTRLGMRTIAFHGNTANFWGRKRGYARLAVDEFRDLTTYPPVDGGWGISDKTFFATNLQWIQRDRNSHALLFMITLSSHAPFDFVKNDRFKGRGIVNAYFNAINYTDQSLCEFLSAVPGKHLVMIYGDHCANVMSSSYNSKIDGKEVIPGILFLVENGQVKPMPDLTPKANITGEGLTIISLSRFLLDLEKQAAPSSTRFSKGY